MLTLECAVGFRVFSKGEYQRLAAQHNIMALVGNGFDIRVASKYGTVFSPRYEAFYEYLQRQAFDPTNLIVCQMAALKAQGRTNWSDIENAIDALVNARGVPGYALTRVREHTAAIQAAFSEYLELVAPPGLLARLGRDSTVGSWSVRSLSKFIGDVAGSSSFGTFSFPATAGHYHLFNFYFVNFNYTPLLDDYVYLDSGQWSPQMHRTVDTHFFFYSNPSGAWGGYGNEDTSFSGYLRAQVVHPHGQQSIPRSLLFGIDTPEGVNPGSHPHRELMKPYWARNDIEYGHLFPEVQLFIVYGCSLGASDGWWWRRILEALVAAEDAGRQCELIIYWWYLNLPSNPESDVVDRFLEGAGRVPTDSIRGKVQGRIHVVPFTELNPPTWLSL